MQNIPASPDRPGARLFPSAGLRILVAEDSKANQLLLQLLLQKMGHRVVLAANGAEAFEQVRAGGVDVILMDVLMPVLDGLAATEAIRQWEGGQGRIPIVALTGRAEESDRLACLQAGMDDYLPKPVDRHLLQAKLAVLANPAAGDPAADERRDQV